MMLHRLALILAWYVCCLFFLYVTDVGEEKRYRGRAGLKRLLLHGVFVLPIAALVSIYVPFFI